MSQSFENKLLSVAFSDETGPICIDVSDVLGLFQTLPRLEAQESLSSAVIKKHVQEGVAGVLLRIEGLKNYEYFMDLEFLSQTEIYRNLYQGISQYCTGFQWYPTEEQIHQLTRRGIHLNRYATMHPSLNVMSFVIHQNSNAFSIRNRGRKL